MYSNVFRRRSINSQKILVHKNNHIWETHENFRVTLPYVNFQHYRVST